MRVVSFAESRDDWHRLAEHSDEAWLFHRPQWIDIESRFFHATNCSFAVRNGDSLAALVPLYFCNDPAVTGGEKLLHSGIHRHAGPVFAPELSSAERNAARSAVMQQIFHIADTKDCDRIVLSSHNLAPRNLTAEREEIPFWVTEHGFFLGQAYTTSGTLPAPGLTTCASDQIIALKAPESELFDGLDEPCRRAVRKAMKAGLEHTLIQGRGGVESYYDLARLSVRRTGEQLPPKEYYLAVVEAFESTDKCALHFATLKGKPVAAVFLLIDKGGASFLAGVSDPDFLSLRVNDYVHWSAILWCKNRGCRSYRLGPVFPEVPPHWPIARVSAFKKKFGARTYTVIQASCYRNVERYRDLAFAHLERLWRDLPTVAVRSAANDKYTGNKAFWGRTLVTRAWRCLHRLYSTAKRARSLE